MNLCAVSCGGGGFDREVNGGGVVDDGGGVVDDGGGVVDDGGGVVDVGGERFFNLLRFFCSVLIFSSLGKPLNPGVVIIVLITTYKACL